MKFFFLLIFSSPSKRIINFFTSNVAFFLSLGKISEVPPDVFDYWLEGVKSSLELVQ